MVDFWSLKSDYHCIVLGSSAVICALLIISATGMKYNFSPLHRSPLQASADFCCPLSAIPPTSPPVVQLQFFFAMSRAMYSFVSQVPTLAPRLPNHLLLYTNALGGGRVVDR